MPSSGPDDWDRLHEDLSRHERDRESLGYPKDAPLPGRVLDLPNLPRYEILDRLGEGATAVVYRAMDRQLQRCVALKVQRRSTAPNDVADSEDSSRNRWREHSQDRHDDNSTVASHRAQSSSSWPALHVPVSHKPIDRDSLGVREYRSEK